MADWSSPSKAVRSIRLRLVSSWLFVGTLLWIGWNVHEVLRIHVFNMGMGAVALIMPRIRAKVPRFAGFTVSVRVRVWVAIIAAVLLAGCFLLPREAQPYLIAALFFPGAVAAIYSEAHVFCRPIKYLSLVTE